MSPDVIVVGARCAGSPLAMMLAQKGHRVVVFDQASFPSECLSTHLIWPPGVAALHRWRLWNQVSEARPGICHRGLTYMPGGTLDGPWHPVEGVNYTVNIRRIKLDLILVEAARAAGADVREASVIDGLLREGERVVGVTGVYKKTGRRFEERAVIIVGADGPRSSVAKLAAALVYNSFPSLTVTYYRYVRDLECDPDVDELYTYPPREYLFSPTDDGLTVVNLVLSRKLAEEFRGNVDHNFYREFDLQPHLGQRLRKSTPVGHIRGVLDQPNFYRRSYGPGWALLGDAAHTKDPIRAQGITDAFLDAEALASALDDVLCHRRSECDALREFEAAKVKRTEFPYQLCLRAARFEYPSVEQTKSFLKRIGNKPSAIAELRGLVAGSMMPEIFYDPRHQATLLGEHVS
jgi:2-polyprenyl-6-methoxyphenol hydroxylase-like FAD-dependent oxidoreductase